jgi:hypothetical protein
MLSIGLWRWYTHINITITILEIFHCLALYLETQKKTLTSSFCWTHVSTFAWRWRQNPISKKLYFKYKTWRWIMSKIASVTLRMSYYIISCRLTKYAPNICVFSMYKSLICAWSCTYNLSGVFERIPCGRLQFTLKWGMTTSRNYKAPMT